MGEKIWALLGGRERVYIWICTFSPKYYYLGDFAENQSYMRVCTWIPYPAPIICVSHLYGITTLYLLLRLYFKSFNLFLPFSKLFWLILVPLHFYIDFKFQTKKKEKSLLVILIGLHWTHACINLGRIGVLTVLSLTIIEHSTSLCVYI